MDFIYLTEAGADKLQKELEHLVKVIRPEATDQLAKAREHGDLSENAEFDAAKENIASIDNQIFELQAKLGQIQIIDESQFSDNSAVRILSQVKLLDLKRDKEIIYTLVDPVQANPTKLLISVQSPVGKALLGKKIDEEISVDVPAGQLKFKVLEITRSEGL